MLSACSTKPESIQTEKKMIQDQFGLAAFFGVLRKAEEEPDLVTLSLGIDLSSLLNFNMKTSDEIHSSFGGPLSPNPVRAENLPWDVPSCYRFSENHCPIQSSSIRCVGRCIFVSYSVHSYCGNNDLRFFATGRNCSHWRWRNSRTKFYFTCSTPSHATVSSKWHQMSCIKEIGVITWKKKFGLRLFQATTAFSGANFSSVESSTFLIPSPGRRYPGNSVSSIRNWRVALSFRPVLFTDDVIQNASKRE